MLSDLLKGLDLLIGALKGTPLRKKRVLAKRLKELYLSLDRIVELGEQLSAAMDRKLSPREFQKEGEYREKHPFRTLRELYPLKEHELVRLLTEKQQAIKQALQSLQSKEIASILRIHLPAFKGLYAMLGSKHCGVGFLLSQLVSATPEKPTVIEIERWGHKAKFKSKWPKEFQQALADPSSKGYYAHNNWMGLTEFTYYDETSISEMRKMSKFKEDADEYWHYHEYGGHLFASKVQRQEFRRLIAGLRKASEALRTMLAKEFTIEDLL